VVVALRIIQRGEGNPRPLVLMFLVGGDLDRRLDHPNQVWSMDITYLPMRDGVLYLAAVIDWFSRYVLAWELSSSLETSFCIEALEEALMLGKPSIFNTDQEVQFTSQKFSSRVIDAGMKFSMDGRGRVFDNIFTERLWRTVKYEEVYLKKYRDGLDAHKQLGEYFRFYNERRVHQAFRKTALTHR
jgi:putative transposase